MSIFKRSALAVATALTVGAATISGASAASTHAGDTLIIETDNNLAARCSLSYVAGEGDNLYGVTAGHCVDPSEYGGGHPTRILNASGDVLWDASSGDIKSQNELGAGLGPGVEVTDYAIFPMKDGVTNTQTVTSTPQIGIPQLEQLLTSPAMAVGDPVPVTDVRAGDIVCKDGSSTGRTCGPVLAVNADTQDLFVLVPAISGDSGAALTVNRGGVLHPIGILSSGSPVLFNMFDSTTQALGNL